MTRCKHDLSEDCPACAKETIAALRADRDKWHRVAMDAGAVTCEGGVHLFPLKDENTALRDRLDFAEFEWNRATDGMKERDATITALRSSADDLVKVLDGLLSFETSKAKSNGFADCTCAGFTRTTDLAYEAGQCPHQIARAALAAYRSRK
jgi:hypothetical protein